MGILLIYETFFKNKNQDCCHVAAPANSADAPSYDYCKRGDKFYRSGTGGITGTIPETQISVEEYITGCKESQLTFTE